MAKLGARIVVCLFLLAVWKPVPALAKRSLAVAMIPPPGNLVIENIFETTCRELGIPARILTPEEFVAPGIFNAKNFPVAVYTGAEAYLYTVHKTGDGTDALLRYVKDGGLLIVTGNVWPFYRPVKWLDGKYVRSDEVPDLESLLAKDKWLQEQMQALQQNPRGVFSIALGLNIGGRGTRQFEKPPEKVVFRRTASSLFPCFSDPTPFPQGDSRYRPVSTHALIPGVQVEPILELVGASGTRYGAGVAVVRHAEAGTVVYFWGPLATRKAVARDVLRFAAKELRLSVPLTAKEWEKLYVLRGIVASSRSSLKNLEPSPALRSYLEKSLQVVDTNLYATCTALEIGNRNRARALLKECEGDLQRIDRKLRAGTTWDTAKQ